MNASGNLAKSSTLASTAFLTPAKADSKSTDDLKADGKCRLTEPRGILFGDKRGARGRRVNTTAHSSK